jgi:pimeloyl-ACP methyl ester carboxylesterase
MSTTSIYKSEAGRTAILEYYQTLLNNWKAPHATQVIPTRHGETFALTSGDPANPPLILLHGSSINSAMWLGDIPHYAQHYRGYAVDLLGEPGQRAPHRLDLQGPALVEWFTDLLTGLKLTTVSIVGCSLGSWMALKFATAVPESVDKLVLMCPSGVAPAKISFLFRAVPLLFCGEWGIKQVNRIVYGNAEIPAEAERFGMLIMKHFKPYVGTLPIFTDAELQRLTMPTFLIAGEQDALLPSAQTAARLKSLLPRLHVKILPNVGHAILNVAPDILTFLTAQS